MITLALLALGHALGVTPTRLVLLATTVYLPSIGIGVIALLLWRARSASGSGGALFCTAVASELRAGSVLRNALRSAAAATTQIDVEGVDWHGDIGKIAAEMARAVPEIGDELRLTIETSSRSGSASAALFDEIGALALALDDVRREVTMATAPGRATAAVLVGAPVVYVMTRITGDGLAVFTASSAQRAVSLAGLLLFVVGAGLSIAVMWRAAKC